MSNDNGIIYLAFGKPYLAMAAVSAASVKAVSPEVKVAVITNVASRPDSLGRLPFDHWIYEDAPTQKNRSYKIRINQYTPFSRTVFMDCDTVAVADIGDLFLYLDHFDTAMQQTGLLVGYKHTEVSVLDGKHIGSLPHWNSGVIAFADRQPVHEFFSNWQAAFDRLGIASDQPSCVEATFASQHRHLSLDIRWNSPVGTYDRYRDTEGESKFRIVHYTQNVVTPDVDRHLRQADRILVEDCGFPDDGAVGDFVDHKHNRRPARLDDLASRDVLPYELW